MKFNLFSFLAILGLACPGLAVAEPSDYDSGEWALAIEQRYYPGIPDGIPTGNGAVCKYNGTDLWSDNGLQIINPFNLVNMDGVRIANAAKVSKGTYASESMKMFLEAALVEARKFSGNEQFVLPVLQLYYEPGPVPFKLLEDRTYKIGFGLYVKNGDKASPAADIKILNSGIYRLSLKNKYTYLGNIYEHFMNNALKYKDKPAKARKGQQRDITNEILKSVPRSVLSDPPENMPEQRTRTMLIKEKEERVKVLSESIITAENHQKRSEILEQIKFEKIEINALQNRKLSAKSSDNLSEYIKYMMSVYDTSENEIPVEPDMESTWTMIEAMLAQNSVEVVSISMPGGLMNKLVNYALENKRTEWLNVFNDVWRVSESGFDVTLACSKRDRFLGCPIKSYGYIVDDDVSEIASDLFEELDSVPLARVNEMIALVANADPEYLDTTFDIDEYWDSIHAAYTSPELDKYRKNADKIRDILEKSYLECFKTREAMDARNQGKHNIKNSLRVSRLRDTSIELPF